MYCCFFRAMGSGHCKKRILESIGEKEDAAEEIQRILTELDDFFESEEETCILYAGDYVIEVYGSKHHSMVYIENKK